MYGTDGLSIDPSERFLSMRMRIHLENNREPELTRCKRCGDMYDESCKHCEEQDRLESNVTDADGGL